MLNSSLVTVAMSALFMVYFLCLDVQFCHGNMSQHPSVPPSITSSLGAQSCLSSSSMHCFSSPHGPVDMQSQTGRLWSSELDQVGPSPGIILLPSSSSSSPSSSSVLPAPVFSSAPFQPPPLHLRPHCQGNRGLGFSLAEVQQELQMLQRQLADASSGWLESVWTTINKLTSFSFNDFEP